MDKTLNKNQINAYVAKANMEHERDIYSIRIDGDDIIINGDWSIERNGDSMEKDVVASIESYCTRENIEWEQDTTYRAWCD